MYDVTKKFEYLFQPRCFVDRELQAEESFTGEMQPVRLSKLTFGGSMEGRLFIMHLINRMNSATPGPKN